MLTTSGRCSRLSRIITKPPVTRSSVTSHQPQHQRNRLGELSASPVALPFYFPECPLREFENPSWIASNCLVLARSRWARGQLTNCFFLTFTSFHGIILPIIRDRDQRCVTIRKQSQPIEEATNL